MKVEIVEFYPDVRMPGQKPRAPLKKGELFGTLHIYLPELNLDIRGVQLKRTGAYMFITMPFRKTIHSDTKQPVIYPLVSLIDKEKHKDMIRSIRKEAVAFMKTWKPS